MANTQMPVTSALRVQLWETADWINPGQLYTFTNLWATGAVFNVDEFKGERARGDQVTYDYTGKLTGIPIGEGGTLDGNEEALDLGSFTMAMNVTRIGVLNPNADTIEQQRTLVDFPEKTRKVIPNRHMELMDTAAFYQLAGANPTTLTINGTTWSGTNKLFVQGHNTPVAPSANRIIRAGAVANDQSLTSTNTMTLDLVDFALEKLANVDQPIMPLSDGSFGLYISPEQWVDLSQDTSGKIQLYNIGLADRTAGKDAFTRNQFQDPQKPMASYRNVNIYVAPRTAYGVNSGTSSVITTVRRAVLVGADALSYASPFGNPDEDSCIKYFEQLKDYGYYKGMEGRAMYGMKKTVASNSEDIGVIVIATYAGAHS